jgi:sugar lactone lactonase YvrE
VRPVTKTGTLVLIFLAGLLAGCSVKPEGVALTLEPEPNAIVWPPPPDTPRYALAKVLIGERDFLPKEELEKEEGFDLGKAMNWLVGILIGPPEYAELRRPVSGMVDEKGWIYVVDASHRAVAVFDRSEHRMRFWPLAGKNLEFESPIAIVGDGQGGFLVTDSELGFVVRLNAEGAPVAQFGANVLSRPTGIARDPASGRIYVVDTAAHDIKVFDAGGQLLDTLGGRGRGPGEFNTPTHAVFSGDTLYVADTFNFRIQAFDRSGEATMAFGRTGLFVGNLTRPKGIAIGGDRRIYVVESYYDHLLVFDSAGQLLLPIGGTGPEVGSFFLPAGAWTDNAGRVYIADMFNGRVVVLQELTGTRGA